MGEFNRVDAEIATNIKKAPEKYRPSALIEFLNKEYLATDRTLSPTEASVNDRYNNAVQELVKNLQSLFDKYNTLSSTDQAARISLYHKTREALGKVREERDYEILGLMEERDEMKDTGINDDLNKIDVFTKKVLEDYSK